MAKDKAARIERILETIEAHPGANLRQVQRLSGLPLATVNRLLEELEAQGLTQSEIKHQYRLYFPVRKGLHKRERVLLRYLNKRRPRCILQTILDTPGIQPKDIAEACDVSPPIVTYYMKQILADDIVVERKRGVARHYRVKNPTMLEKALSRTAQFDPKVA